MTANEILQELTERYPQLKTNESEIHRAFLALKSCFENGNRLYLCGNGGSAADCEHIAGELLKNFKVRRPIDGKLRENLSEYGEEGKNIAEKLEGALPVISLCGHNGFGTAFSNDKDPSLVFAQQINAWGKEKDVLLALSTSGNSQNCVKAAIVAKAKEMQVLFLGGGTGGKLVGLADVSVIVPEKETYKVQELHLPVYHCLCAMLEAEFFA